MTNVDTLHKWLKRMTPDQYKGLTAVLARSDFTDMKPMHLERFIKDKAEVPSPSGIAFLDDYLKGRIAFTAASDNPEAARVVRATNVGQTIKANVKPAMVKGNTRFLPMGQGAVSGGMEAAKNDAPPGMGEVEIARAKAREQQAAEAEKPKGVIQQLMTFGRS